MPQTLAHFAYDVIGSSSNDDDQLEEVRENASRLVLEALAQAGVDPTDRVNYSPTGDGSLASYSEVNLPALIDATYYLDGKLQLHNRQHLPPIRLRVSVHTGPARVTDGESFQRRTIELARGLDAAVFKEIVRRIDRYRPLTLAVILSEQAYRVAVAGRYTERLKPHNFGQIEVANKEFTERCWVHVPELDAERVRELSLPESTDHTGPAKEIATTEKAAASRRMTINGGFQGTAVGGDSSGAIHQNFFGPRP